MALASTFAELPLPWQASFEQAWEAYCAGTTAIGAVITDASGQIIARSRNRKWDDHAPIGQVSGHVLAHAELNVLLSLRPEPPDRHNCAIYTTVEPCPLCLGAIYMAGIRAIHYASRDPYAGSTNLLGTTPYLSYKPVRTFGPIPGLEEAATALSLMRYYAQGLADGSLVLKAYGRDCPQALALTHRVYRTGALISMHAEGFNAGQVYDTLIHTLKELPTP